MSRLKIYGIPQSRAFRALWCAGELGLEYDSIPIRFDNETSKAAEYLAINPNGKIPAIDDGGFVLWESMAINCYLARKHGKGLWPSTVEGEGLVLQWSFFAVAELEKPLLAVLLNSPAVGRPDRDTKAAEEGAAAARKPLAVLDAALAGSPYLLGSDFTVADLNCGSLILWGQFAGFDFSSFPHIAKWLAACLARPAVQKLLARRG
jgi:glutathione S-transferase